MNQRDMFNEPAAQADSRVLISRKKEDPARFEVHTHAYVSGPNAVRGYHNNWSIEIEHSHERGSEGHKHPDTGPACYVIDKDEWARATGMKGGGRKKYTKRPTGPQLDYIERTAEESTFEVIFANPPHPPYSGEKPKLTGGIAAVHRMAQTFRLKPILKVLK